jgi:hypothetical protein
MDERASRRCVVAFVGVLLTAALSIGACNWLIDPYRVFGAPVIEGINARKPLVGEYARMIKAWESTDFRAAAIILGTSRAEVGLDPNHPGWRAHPVYNLALPSARIYETYRYLLHADAQRRLEQIVLALDFSMFNGAVPNQAGFDEGRLDSPGAFGPNVQRLHDAVTMLFSIDGLKASLRTIRSQRTQFVSYLPAGERHPTEKWEEIREMGGHRAAFIKDAGYEMRTVDGWTLFSFVYPTEYRYHTTFEPLSEILRYCAARGIELKVTISPLHAHKLLEIRQAGLWEKYEDWKRTVVRMIEDVNAESHVKYISLWDFSGLHGFNTEPLPAPGDADTRMRWYWEGSHYQRAVGDAILDRVFGVESSGMKVPNDFGFVLTASTIEEHLVRVRRDLDRYAANHQDEVRTLAGLYLQAAGARAKLLSSQARHVPVR